MTTQAQRTNHAEWTFESVAQRDAFLEESYPERVFSRSDVPGLYNLPGGDALGVLGLTVTHYGPEHGTLGEDA